MSELSKKIITTEGDSKINTVTALGELQHIASCMSKSMVNLNDYVEENIVANSHKQNVIAKLKILCRSIELVGAKIKYVTVQQGMVNLSGVTQHMKRAASNLHHKREQLMNPTCSKKYLCAEDKMLTSILLDESSSHNKKQKSSKSPVRTLPSRSVNVVRDSCEQKPVMNLR